MFSDSALEIHNYFHVHFTLEHKHESTIHLLIFLA